MYSLTPIHATVVMQMSLTYSEVWGNCKASSLAIKRQEMVAALSMAYVQSAFPLIFTLVIHVVQVRLVP